MGGKGKLYQTQMQKNWNITHKNIKNDQDDFFLHLLQNQIQ